MKILYIYHEKYPKGGRGYDCAGILDLAANITNVDRILKGSSEWLFQGSTTNTGDMKDFDELVINALNTMGRFDCKYISTIPPYQFGLFNYNKENIPLPPEKVARVKELIMAYEKGKLRKGVILGKVLKIG